MTVSQHEPMNENKIENKDKSFELWLSRHQIKQFYASLFNEKDFCCSSIFTSFRFWFRFCGYSPASSTEWGNRRSEVIHSCGCFHSVSIPMRGDIVAFPSNHGTTHCGIVTTGGHFIGTTNKRIVETKMPAHVKRVFWRYTGDVPNTDRLLEKY